MASKWIWNGIDLWVNEEDISREVKRAELFVVDATSSVFQFLGAASRKYSIKGLVLTNANRDSLEADSIANTSRTLTTPYGSIANLKINSFKANAKQYAGLTLGGVSYMADVTPLYEFTAELIVDV